MLIRYGCELSVVVERPTPSSVWSKRTNIMHALSIILVGFVAGIIARNLLPGSNNPSGFILTTVLGIAGAFVATYLGQQLGWYRLDQGAGFIGATIGAVLVLFIWHRLVVTRMVTDPTTRGPLIPRRWL